MIRSFRDLEIYKESYELMLLIHKFLLKLPLHEKHDLASQLRRAAKSIPANIAEGWGRRVHEKEFRRHLDIAMASSNEMEVHVQIAKDLSYWENGFCEDLLKRYLGSIKVL